MKFHLVFVDEQAKAFYEGKAPAYATPNSCALDLRACIPNTITLEAGEQKLIGSGLKIQLDPEDQSLPDDIRVGSLILPRSGKGAKEGLALGNTMGLIDADYQGEIMMMVWARPIRAIHRPGAAMGFGILEAITDPEPKLVIQPGERIAQLAFGPFFIAESFKIMEEFPEATERGAGGFGSTGQG